VHFISVCQVSSDAATLRRGRCGAAGSRPSGPPGHAFTPPPPPPLLLLLLMLCIGNLMIKN